MAVEVKHHAWPFCVITIVAELENDRVHINCSCGKDMSIDAPGEDWGTSLGRAILLVQNHLPPLPEGKGLDVK